MAEISPLERARRGYAPRLPRSIAGDISMVSVSFGDATRSESDQSEIEELFPKTYGAPIATVEADGGGTGEAPGKRVAVILSGGQAPGGHNVIAGLYDALQELSGDSVLYGFRGGPGGILKEDIVEITSEMVAEYRNSGGFDMIGSGRTKIESPDQFTKTLSVVRDRKLDALVIIGGDDSNTNAALLAEYFAANDQPTAVIGVPKTIDGDLKTGLIETSFGFDTATKTYSELIGNIERDANSARKYWHFIKLMGRSASHIALECALQTRPNICIISEEVAELNQTIDQLVDRVVEVIAARAAQGNNFGVVLVPEGLIEFIPEMKKLIAELNDILAESSDYFGTLNTFEAQSEYINRKLSRDSSYVFSSLPNEIQRQLLMDRDPHGNVQVSRIETEKLLIDMTKSRLDQMKSEGSYKGSFSALQHFFGYEGRCAFPSNFDTNYCYALGRTASVLIKEKLTGYMATVRNLTKDPEEWQPAGLPITMLLNLEQRKGKRKPVIRKALVDLSGRPFQVFKEARDSWAVPTAYTYPGSIQYFGPGELADATTITLRLEAQP
ncbi:MAG: diphosphate--fructose-6-phosphate 1-phosphotransferase [Spirochaetaceae bacterium]